MTIFELKRRATEQEVDHKEAILERQKFVIAELYKWDDYINEVNDDIPELTMNEAVDELLQLEKALKFINKPPPKNEITQEMIDEVKSIPVENLVEIIRGKTKCFAHDDKSPSAYIATRTNKLCCPVCGKMWDTVDIKMVRDGMTFIDAVRSLHAGNY